MLKVSHCLSVVFTQSYPMLEIFANQHFLPTHPLRHHPLWLDENDFTQNQHTARSNNLPHPFKINPYAHHPQLSPYAVKGKRKPKTSKKERSSLEKTGADSTNANKKHNHSRNASVQNETTAPSSLYTSPSAKNMKSEQYKVPICLGTVYPRMYFFNLEQMYIRAGFTNNNCSSSSTNLDALSTLHNINCLQLNFTLEQNSNGSNSLTENDKRDANGREEDELYDSNACNALSAIKEASERRLERLKQDNMYSPLIEEGMKLLRAIYPTPPHCNGALSVMTGKIYHYKMSEQLVIKAQKHGYRSPWWGTLKQWGKLGASMLPGEESHAISFGRNTKLVHISLLSNAEEVLQNSYISASRGYMRFINLSESEKFSLDNVDALNSLLSSNTLTSNSSDDIFDDENYYSGVFNEPNKSTELETSAKMRKKLFLSAIIRDIKQHNYTIPLYMSYNYLLKHNLKLRNNAEGVCVEPFDVVSASIDNNKDNICISSISKYSHCPEFDLRESKMESARLATNRKGETNNYSNELSPTSFSSSISHEQQKEEQYHRQFQGNQGIITDDSNTRSKESLSSYSAKCAHQPKPIVEVRHYYHLSQVRFPETFFLPAEVLASELSNPSVPLHGLTGQVLDFDELRVDKLANTMPEVAAVINQRPRDTPLRSNSSHDTTNKHKVEEQNVLDSDISNHNATENTDSMSDSNPNNSNELSAEEIDEFVMRNRSPKQHHGRHLWFTAKDILEHNGLVDVNATPVEVLVHTSHSPVDMPERKNVREKTNQEGDVVDDTDSMNWETVPLRHYVYNVACLTHPEHALKLVNSYFHEEKDVLK